MSPSRTPAAWACLAGVLALLALHLAWHGSLAWRAQPAPVLLLIFGLPLLAIAAGLILRRPSARFWSGVAALVTFCHGIAEAWAIPAARVPGLLEMLLSVAVVLASSWDGLRARFGAGRRRRSV